ncbi:MAG: two-component regulator propeller domain-containing protein [Ferruginibacter sp.]
MSHASYRINDGLMHSQVIDLAEDGNGFIWISTGSGIQRFDGKFFYDIPAPSGNKGIPDDKYVSFFSLKNGNLWLRHSKGISEYNMHTNRFQNVLYLPDANAENIPVPVYEEENGTWCQLPSGGIYFLNKEKQYTDSVLFDSNSAWSSLITSHKKNGGVQFSAFNAASICVADSRKKTYRIFYPGPLQRKFAGIANFTEDTLLVATQRGIEKMDIQSGKFLFVSAYKKVSHQLATYIYVKLHRLQNGNYLVSEGRDIYELNLKQPATVSKLVTLQDQPFFNAGNITRFYNDSHDNFWIISERDGITKVNYRFSGFRYFGSTDKKKNFIKTIYADKKDNRLLCAAAGNGLLVFDTLQQLLTAIEEFPGAVTPHTIAAIQKTAPHRYLVFLMRGWKVYLLNTENFTLQPVQVDSSNISLQHEFDYHSNIFVDENNQMLMQSSFHIYKMEWQPPSVIRFTGITNIPVASVSSYRDRHQQLWVGGRKNYFLVNNSMQSYRSFEMPYNIIARCFYMDAANNLWMGTEKGLYQLNATGKIINRLYVANGLADDNIYALTGDNNNNLWISHNKGISCMKSNGDFVHYSKYDGLQENEFNTNCFFKTNDGEIFFGGVNGVSSFYPAAILKKTEQPRLFVTSIKIKDKEWETETALWNVEKIKLPYFKNSLAFEFTALGVRQPDMYNYQFRMIGADDAWINGTNAGAARYVLPPGKYIFEVYAGNSFNKDAQPLKSILITIDPPFWKTAWFVSLILLLLAIIIILITRYVARIKLKRRITELERKKELDEERLRISREMHDDIGAGLTQITMMSEAAKTKEHSNVQLDKIAAASRKLVNDMSEIIWSMHPEQNTLDQLFSYLREQLHQLLEYSGIAYKIDFPLNGNEVLLNNAQKRNLLLVTKEIVHNAVKHSKAKNISIVAFQKNNILQFVILDDGSGFDTNRPGNGNGLRNINKRIEELGGKLHIESTNGKGSSFSYQMPLF